MIFLSVFPSVENKGLLGYIPKLKVASSSLVARSKFMIARSVIAATPGIARGLSSAQVRLTSAARRVMTMAVNDKGVLGVLVVERRAQSGDACLFADFYASFNGGASFTPPARVSASACGTSPADVIAGRMFPTNGDYFGLITTPDGRFRALWPEMRGGASVLLTATIEVKGRVAAPAAKN